MKSGWHLVTGRCLVLLPCREVPLKALPHIHCALSEGWEGRINVPPVFPGGGAEGQQGQ